MSEREGLTLVGRCGIYCGACGVYVASREGGDIRGVVAERLDISEEELSCRGCGDLTESCYGSRCEIVKCLDGKEYVSCAECEEFVAEECALFDGMKDCMLESSGVDIRENLERLRIMDEERWLEENSKRWVCKSCGAPIYYGLTRCHRCSGPLW